MVISCQYRLDHWNLCCTGSWQLEALRCDSPYSLYVFPVSLTVFPWSAAYIVANTALPSICETDLTLQTDVSLLRKTLPFLFFQLEKGRSGGCFFYMRGFMIVRFPTATVFVRTFILTWSCMLLLCYYAAVFHSYSSRTRSGAENKRAREEGWSIKVCLHSDAW